MFSSHSFWTSSSSDVPAGVTQEEGHTGGRSHRIFHPPSFFCGACLNFSREKVSATRWAFFFFFFFSEKNPVCRDRTHVPTCQKVTRLPLSYRGGRDNDRKLTYRSSATRYIRHLPVVLVVFVFHTISYICDSMSKR